MTFTLLGASLALLSALLGPLCSAQNRGDVTDALKKKGFENLRCMEDSVRIIYTIENNVYKLQPSGVTEALRTLRENGGIADGKECMVIFTDMNVPRVSLKYADGEWKASNKGYSKEWGMVKSVKRTASSFGDIDIAVYPQLYTKNLIINQIYQYLLEVSPTLELTLWPGAKLSAQVIIPALNDGYYNEYRNVRPGYLTLQQAFRLPFDSWGDVRLGTFDTRTFGGEVNVAVPLDGGHWTMNAKYAYVGIGLFEDFDSFIYNGSSRDYWSFGPDYWWKRYNTVFKLRAEKYMLGEIGAKAEMVRHFKHCSIGMYAEKAWLSGTDIPLNGGFRFYIALPPYRYRRSGKLPRVTTGLSTGMSYNAGTELSYFMMPVSLADENPLKQARFNAYYIESYLNTDKKRK